MHGLRVRMGGHPATPTFFSKYEQSKIVLDGGRREGDSGARHSSGKQLGRTGMLLGKIKGRHWALWGQESCRHGKEGPRIRKMGWERTNVTDLMVAGIAA